MKLSKAEAHAILLKIAGNDFKQDSAAALGINDDNFYALGVIRTPHGRLEAFLNDGSIVLRGTNPESTRDASGIYDKINQLIE